MATIEQELANIFLSVDDSDLQRYLALRHRASRIVTRANQEHPDDVGLQMAHLSEASNFRDEMSRVFYQSPEIAKAVIASMTIAQLGRPRRRINSAYVFDYYLPNETRGVYQEVIGMIGELNPRTPGYHSKAHMDVIANTLDSDTIEEGPELLAILGTDGSGKSTAIRLLREFADRLKIKVSTVKFPTTSGPASETILRSLSQEVETDGVALQLLFLADMFQFLSQIDDNIPIYVSDRLALYDGQVYSPDFTKLVSAYSFRAVDIPVSALIIDRHPKFCKSRINVRSGQPTLFEGNAMQIAAQQVEFFKLLKLPAVWSVNTDISIGDPNDWLLTQTRIIAASALTGIWQRGLVKSGLAETFEDADRIVFEEVNGFFFRQEKNF